MDQFDLENPFMGSGGGGGEDDAAALFAAENDHSPEASMDPVARRDAVSVILQAQFEYDLDPAVAYLAVNYVDRFLSKRSLPKDKPWVAQLLAIACLSLAGKMKRVHSVQLSDHQIEEVLFFDSKTVRRMEAVVLGTLDWRMRSITPFSFLSFFLAYISPRHSSVVAALKARSEQIIFKTQTEFALLHFKASAVAAAAIMSAAREILPGDISAFRAALSTCEFVNKERLQECCEAMSEATAISAGGECGYFAEAASSAATPVTVLTHQHFPSANNSSESERTVGSTSDALDLKKRRISTSRYRISHPNRHCR